jgi:hypothetical protein
MKEKKLYEQPSMIVIKLCGKVGFMSSLSNETAGVREHHGNFSDNDWETE